METRDVVIAAGAAAALAVLGLSLYVPEEPQTHPAGARGPAGTQTQDQNAPSELKSAEETIVTMLPLLEKEDEMTVRTGVEQIQLALSDDGSRELSEDTRDKLAASLLQVYARTKEETPEGTQFKGSVARLLIGKVGGNSARTFAVETLSTGSDAMKLAAVEAFLEPGSIRGKEVRAKALEAARSAAVPDELKPIVFRTALGKRSEGEIVDLFQRDVSTAALRACAVELQNLHRPRLIGVILERLDQRGLLGSSSQMPWISGRLLSEYMRTADRNGLARALTVIRNRPGLARATSKAVQERLGDKDSLVRLEMAALIGHAAGPEGMDPESSEQVLVARLKEESDPAVKGTLEDSLAKVRLTRQPQDPPKPEATVTR